MPPSIAVGVMMPVGMLVMAGVGLSLPVGIAAADGVLVNGERVGGPIHGVDVLVGVVVSVATVLVLTGTVVIGSILSIAGVAGAVLSGGVTSAQALTNNKRTINHTFLTSHLANRLSLTAIGALGLRYVAPGT